MSQFWWNSPPSGGKGENGVWVLRTGQNTLNQAISTLGQTETTKNPHLREIPDSLKEGSVPQRCEIFPRSVTFVTVASVLLWVVTFAPARVSSCFRRRFFVSSFMSPSAAEPPQCRRRCFLLCSVFCLSSPQPACPSSLGCAPTDFYRCLVFGDW